MGKAVLIDVDNLKRIASANVAIGETITALYEMAQQAQSDAERRRIEQALEILLKSAETIQQSVRGSIDRAAS
jgi:RNA polymerase-interacting CarD/CdnL/TRCF family regulator